MGLNLTALGAGAGAAADEFARQQTLALAANADKRAQTLADQQATVFGQGQESRTATIAANATKEDALAQIRSMTAPAGYQQPAAVPTVAGSFGAAAQPPVTGLRAATGIPANTGSLNVAGGVSPAALSFGDSTYNSDAFGGGENGHQYLSVKTQPHPAGGAVSQFTDKATQQPLGAPVYWTPDQITQHTNDALASFRSAMIKADPANGAHYAQMDFESAEKLKDRLEKKYEADLRATTEDRSSQRTLQGSLASSAAGTTNAGIAASASRYSTSETAKAAANELALKTTEYHDKQSQAVDDNETKFLASLPEFQIPARPGTLGVGAAPATPDLAKIGAYKKQNATYTPDVPFYDTTGMPVMQKGPDGKPILQNGKPVPMNITNNPALLSTLSVQQQHAMTAQKLQGQKVQANAEKYADSGIGLIKNWQGGPLSFTAVGDSNNPAIRNSIMEQGGPSFLQKLQNKYGLTTQDQWVMVGRNAVPLKALYTDPDTQRPDSGLQTYVMHAVAGVANAQAGQPGVGEPGPNAPRTIPMPPPAPVQTSPWQGATGAAWKRPLAGTEGPGFAAGGLVKRATYR